MGASQEEGLAMALYIFSHDARDEAAGRGQKYCRSAVINAAERRSFYLIGDSLILRANPDSRKGATMMVETKAEMIQRLIAQREAGAEVLRLQLPLPPVGVKERGAEGDDGKESERHVRAGIAELESPVDDLKGLRDGTRDSI